SGTCFRQQYFYKISAVDLYFNEGPKTTVQSATTAKPLITSATYNATTKVLTVTGTNFLAFAGALNDIDVPKLKIRGEGGLERAISTSGKAEITDATTFSVTLAGSDQSAINSFINKNGSSSTGSTVYNLTATNGWAAGEDASINTEQTTIAITVSDVPVPTITYAEYNGQTGSLLVVGTNFYRLNGSNNDIVASKFTFTGEGGNTHTLQVTPNVEILGDKTFILALGSADKAAISQILNRNGTSAVDNTTFNLAAAEDWNAGAEASVNIADLTGNPVTVSNYVNVVLPIELVNFSHKKTNSDVVLNWSTSAEVNNKEFRLSRSIDGKDFTVIGAVNGTGNSSSLQNYSFTDKKPLIGQSYYKLTQVDLDNVIKLEKIIPVSFYINSDEVVIYPNPATDVVSIKSNSSRYTKATLLDVSGKILGTYTLLTDVTDIDVAKLPKGVYLLNLSSNSENTVRKIVKN
ncbi:MAG: T9SS type A sorting domain-containing protein, partial [Flavobacterium sp.]